MKKDEARYFSKNEIEVIRIIGNKKISISDITDDLYKGKQKPFNASNVVANAVRRIRDKCKFYKLLWTVNSEGLGRNGSTVWIEE